MKLPLKWPLLLGTAVMVTGCGDAPVTPDTRGPSLAISDGAHSGNPHFFFLPPMVPNPEATGSFDGSLFPEAQICVWDGTVCGATLAVFTPFAGPGSETIRVNTQGQHYIVNWHTDEILENFTLGPGETFRVRVLVRGQELGFADIDVVGRGRKLKNVQTADFVPLLDGRTLPIRFRIEEGALEEGDFDIAGGFLHSCAVAGDGRAFCWGRNADGQLGIGVSGGSFATPQLVAGNLAWQSVSTGNQHTCGLTADGQAYCWGRNNLGQLGLGAEDFILHPSPEPVVGGHVFQSVRTGVSQQFHSCGVTTAGDMLCWGLNSFGELGNGTFTFIEPTPVLVVGGLTFAGSLAMDRRFTCGVTTDGNIYCWGFNDFAQLGRGTLPPPFFVNTPGLVAGGHTFASVTAGAGTACGLTPDGVALCWGRNTEGELGIGTFSDDIPLPQFVTGGHTFTELSSGFAFTCGVRTDGAGLCWGRNGTGQLGRGFFGGNFATPALVAGDLTLQTIDAGFEHACGVTSAGGAFCWGFNFDGQLGDGTFTDNATPQFAMDLNPGVP